MILESVLEYNYIFPSLKRLTCCIREQIIGIALLLKCDLECDLRLEHLCIVRASLKRDFTF